jgi:glucuronate isomerase
MELSGIFGIQETLNEQNAMEIWGRCNGMLDQPGFGAVDILKKFNAEILCTSDELLADLSPHVSATQDQEIRVFPSLRGDSMLAFDQPAHRDWLEKLTIQTGIKISSLDDYQAALVEGLKRFEKAGCRLADHSLDAGFRFMDAEETAASVVFKEFIAGKEPGETELVLLQNHLLEFLGKEYAKRDWVLQLHIGAQRKTSSRLRKLAGSAGGYSTMGVSCDIGGLVRYFDRMESDGLLPRIILYTLNPTDYEAFATLTGSFAEDGLPGKIQFGPAWWYNDQYFGNRSQLQHLASHGVLSQFIGMTTDSRSVLSFSRHEYFRRILCDQLGEWVEAGIVPDDPELLSGMVKDVCYYNAKKWIFDE